MNTKIKEPIVSSTDKHYLLLLNETQERITSTRIQVTKAVIKSQSDLYWWLGEKLVTAQHKNGWGVQL